MLLCHLRRPRLPALRATKPEEFDRRRILLRLIFGLRCQWRFAGDGLDNAERKRIRIGKTWLLRGLAHTLSLHRGPGSWRERFDPGPMDSQHTGRPLPNWERPWHRNCWPGLWFASRRGRGCRRRCWRRWCMRGCRKSSARPAPRGLLDRPLPKNHRRTSPESDNSRIRLIANHVAHHFGYLRPTNSLEYPIGTRGSSSPEPAVSG